MNFVRLVFDGDNYRCKEATSMELCMLGFFLANDVGFNASRFRAWIIEGALYERRGAITSIQKKFSAIMITDPYAGRDTTPYLKLSYEQFMRILDEWEKMCSEKSQQIFITKEDEAITFEIIQ